ncbi:MAG: TetR/AcrR family transcriptional regulator [Myxococcota bacterium]
MDAILTATAHILREVGPGGATTNRIAKRAGVSIGSLYQYFPDKTALYTAVAQQYVDRIDAELQRHFERMATVEVDAMFPAMVEALFAIARVDAPLGAALQSVSLWGQTSGLLMEFRARLERDFAQLLAARAPDFPIPIVDPETTARVIVRAVSGIFDATLVGDPEPFTDPRLMEEIIELLSKRFGL